MCGISGLIMGDGKRAAQEDLSLMARAMIRRGPDAEGYLTEGPVGFAHRRLKIIDLSDAANQPLYNEDRKLAVVYNGEIYNFRELARELKNLGHVFRSHSDTEVIVHAYEEWGENSFARFNGMFSFALWDSRGVDPVVYLVRDRFGIKPLFLGVSGGHVAFASELKPIMSLSWFKKSIDPKTLYYFLKFSHVPQPLSIFSEISQLKPGTFVRITGGKLRHETYFDLSLQWRRGADHAGRAKVSEAEALLQLRKVLLASVERQLVSDVPLGCFLSGGIDSSLLTMACAEIGERGGLRGPLQTFSIGYREAGYDETGFAREIADYFKTKHRELIVEPRDFFDLIADVPRYFDQPFADPTLLPSLLLSRFAREHVTVALSGDGGDELFFGYTQQRALIWLRLLDRLPGRARKGFFHLLATLAAAGAKVTRSRAFHQAEKLFEILQFRNEAELYQYFVGTIGPLRVDRIAALISGGTDTELPLVSQLLGGLGDAPAQEVITQIFLQTFLPDTVLTKTDRSGMAFSLEARVPFLDDEMFEFAAGLPFSFKSSPMQSKLLLRKLLAQELGRKGVSKNLAWRSKQGFSVPVAQWLRGELKYLLDEYLSDYRLKREGVFNEREVVPLVRAHLSGAANHSHLLWSLISFQMWKECFRL